MQFWAQLRGIGPSQLRLLRDLLRVHTSSMRPIRELAFVDAGGATVVRSGERPSAETSDTERRALAFHRAHASLGPLVMAASSTQPESMLTISRRFDDRRGRMAGMVVATIAVSSLRPLFTAVDVGRNGAIGLFLSSGAIVLRKPFDVIIPASQRRSAFIAAQARGPSSGSVTLRSAIDGRSRIAAFCRVAGFPLVVAIGFATADVFAAWRIGTIVGLLSVCGGIVTIVLLARALLAQIDRTVRAQAQLSLFASHDSLTGLFNRREFDIGIEREWLAGARDTTPLALMLLDVDWFKAYNDRYGHQLGDEVLRRIAACLRDRCARPRDVVARYGGEEFVALLPVTSLDAARQLAEYVRRDVAGLRIEHAAGEPTVVTISLGVAAGVPTRDGSPAELIRQADLLMYDAKRAGRNRVMAHEGRSAG